MSPFTLTDAHLAAMPTYRDGWIGVVSRMGVTDWGRVEAAITGWYDKAGLAPPGRIVRVQSPLVGALAAALAIDFLDQGQRWVEYAIEEMVREGVSAWSAS